MWYKVYFYVEFNMFELGFPSPKRVAIPSMTSLVYPDIFP